MKIGKISHTYTRERIIYTNKGIHIIFLSRTKIMVICMRSRSQLQLPTAWSYNYKLQLRYSSVVPYMVVVDSYG